MQKQEELMIVIARVQQMEIYFDELLITFNTNPKSVFEDAKTRKMISELTQYMDGGQWLKDYECDERGELPEYLKRGVLSQDGLYNLLCDIEAKKRERKK